MVNIRVQEGRKGVRKPGAPKKEKGPLNDDLRAEIVTRFAMYDTLSEIHRSLTERGIDISVQGVQHYNPTGGNRSIADRWVTLFHDTRAKFQAEMMDEPIAQRAYRLRELHKLYLQARDRGALPLAASLLEQAAKETGGLYTNVTKLKGQVEALNTPEVTSDEQRIMLAQRLSDALMKRAKPVAAKQLSEHTAKG